MAEMIACATCPLCSKDEHDCENRALQSELAALKAALAESERARAELEAQLARESLCRDLAENCGQDGVCAIAPGCQRHWADRNRELVAERDAYRAALENAADDGHSEMCVTMRLYRGCTCHQQETLKALGWACPACDGEGAAADADRPSGRRRCAVCDASGCAALALLAGHDTKTGGK